MSAAATWAYLESEAGTKGQVGDKAKGQITGTRNNATLCFFYLLSCQRKAQTAPMVGTGVNRSVGI